VKHISSVEDFFNSDKNLIPAFETSLPIRSIQEEMAYVSHQLFLWDNFETIPEINEAESILWRNGYNPVFLSLEGAYFETLYSVRALQQINEGLFDTVKDFVSAMTDGGSPIGILQFVLDIIGLIPFSWGGVPIDGVANFLNGIIYLYRGEYLMGLINMLMTAMTGYQAVVAPAKLAIKPIAKAAETLISKLFSGKGGAAAASQCVEEIGKLSIESSAKANGLENLAFMLTKIGEWIATAGLKVIRFIGQFIDSAMRSVSFGALGLPKTLFKWIDDITLRMTSFSKASTEAADVLAKEAKAAASGADDILTKGSRAAQSDLKTGLKQTITNPQTGQTVLRGATQREADDLAKKFLVNADSYEKSIITSVHSSTAYKELVAKGASPKVLEIFTKGATTEKMVGDILAKGVNESDSLIQLLKNSDVIDQLAAKGYNAVDQSLAKAIKSGDTAKISELFKIISETPAAAKGMSKKVAKTVSVFREAPELLVKGTKRLSRIQDDLLKFTGVNAYKRITGTRFILMLVKTLLKGTDCGKYINSSYFSDGAQMNEALDTEGLVKIFSGINEEDLLTKSEIGVSKDVVGRSYLSADQTEIGTGLIQKADALTDPSMIALQASDPGLWQKVKDQVTAGQESLTKLMGSAKGNPCLPQIQAAEAQAGIMIQEPGMYKGKGGAEYTRLTKEGDFKQLNDYTKKILKTLDLPSDIDPQHSLYKDDPWTKLYFADVINPQGEYDPTRDGETRLDDAIKYLSDNGEIDASKSKEIKAEIMNHWEKGTMPESTAKRLGQGEGERIEIKESALRIGRLVLRK